MLSRAPVSTALLDAVTRLDERVFAEQRNALHYSVEWPFLDLFAFCSPLGFCRFSAPNGVLDRLSGAAEDFTIAVAFSVFWIARSLLRTIAVNATAIAAEC